MQIIHLDETTIINEKLVVTIGQFDGLHLGHMALINRLLGEKKDNLKSCLITFNPHIDTVLFNQSPNNHLLTLENKIKKLNDLGIDYLLEINFTKEIAKIDHEQFYNKYLKNLKIEKLIVGFDFTYGYKGLGNTNTLKEIYQDNLIVIPKMEINNQKVGSFEIKKYLLNSDFEKAAQLLGYQFYLTGDIEENKFSCVNINIIPKDKYIVSINNQEYILNTIDNSINCPNQKNINIIIKSKLLVE